MKRGRRLISEAGLAYFVTTTLSGFVRLFDDERYAHIILDNLDFYRRKFEFKLAGYVIMPSHLHMIVQPSPTGSLSEIMRDFKKHSAREIIQKLEGDRRVDILGFLRARACTYHPKESRRYQVWEDRFDDVALYSDDVFSTKLCYIHDNPVKAGLSESAADYPYSSARNYLYGDHSVLYVDCEMGLRIMEMARQVRSGT